LSAYDLSSYNFYFLPICFLKKKKKKEEAISLVRTPWGMSNLPNLTKTGFKKIRREKVE
jgi:hypothetical protein